MTDNDPNAPWLSLAHIMCADAGIPPGPIMSRLEALRDKLDEWRQIHVIFCVACGKLTTAGDIHTCTPPNIKELVVTAKTEVTKL